MTSWGECGMPERPKEDRTVDGSPQSIYALLKGLKATLQGVLQRLYPQEERVSTPGRDVGLTVEPGEMKEIRKELKALRRDLNKLLNAKASAKEGKKTAGRLLGLGKIRAEKEERDAKDRKKKLRKVKEQIRDLEAREQEIIKELREELDRLLNKEKRAYEP